MEDNLGEDTSINKVALNKSNKFRTFEFIEAVGIAQPLFSIAIVLLGVSRTTFAYSTITKSYSITSGNQLLVLSFVVLTFIVASVLNIILMWVNKNDTFIQSLSLKFVKRLKPTIFASMVVFYISLIDIGITFSNPLPTKYAGILLSLSALLVYGFASIIFYLLFLIVVYSFTPRIDGLKRSLFHKSIYGIGGVEIVSVLTHFEEYQGITTAYSKFLFNSLHSTLRNILQYGYPRFKIESLEETISNLYLTVKQGPRNEKLAVKKFLKKLIELERTPLNQLTMESYKFLEEIYNLNGQLTSANELRTKNKMKGIWNLSVIYFLEQNSTALIVIFTIMGVFLGGITLLLIAHLL